MQRVNQVILNFFQLSDVVDIREELQRKFDINTMTDSDDLEIVSEWINERVYPGYSLVTNTRDLGSFLKDSLETRILENYEVYIHPHAYDISGNILPDHVAVLLKKYSEICRLT